MSLHISYAPHRSLFKRPFGTAHGLRDGTDSLFIRLEEHGAVGYGEVTLPPYVSETIPDTIGRLKSLALRGPWTAESLQGALDALPELANGASAARAGLSMASLDLLAKQRSISVRELLGLPNAGRPVTLMTVGIGPAEDLPTVLGDLPASTGLKVKVGDAGATLRIEAIKQLDNRMLLIDGNQGLVSAEEAVSLIEAVGSERMICLEQPFSTDQDQLNLELHGVTGARIFADESVQGIEDLEAKHGLFSGVNIKLMKCGGIDKALAMADRAMDLGLGVMLGSMSESSLGCTAMAQIMGKAEIVDLDGPWLVKNDPFVGIRMEAGNLMLPDGPGLGVVLKAPLEFIQIGA